VEEKKTFLINSAKEKKDRQEIQVVDMNKIIAFRKLCTETVGAFCFCPFILYSD